MSFKVFISSTLYDLIDHRTSVRQALLNAGLHPIDMIDFMARPQEATTASKEEVREADLFVGIYAWRYGHIPEGSGVSITEEEFLEAQRLGKPCFCFFVEENYHWPDEYRDSGSKADQLREFKLRIDKTLVRATFTDPDDLAKKVLAGLQRWERRSSRGPMLSKAEARERKDHLLLLEKVKNFWVKGVLERTEDELSLLQIGKKEADGEVKRPWQMLLETPDQEPQLIPAGKKVFEIYKEKGRSLLILGEPGAGKTITLLEFARDAVAIAEADSGEPIPVVLNLSSWSQKQRDLTNWLIEELKSKYQIPVMFGRRWLENRDLLLLLDGLDEVEKKSRSECVEAINRFRDNYGLLGIVICSRSEEYSAIAKPLNIGGAIFLLPLESEQIYASLAAAGAPLANLREALREDDGLRELAATPLMLGMMCQSYRELPSKELMNNQPKSTEERRMHLFDTYIHRMFRRHGDKQTYSLGRTCRWLNWMAREMKRKNNSTFLIEDLQPDCLTGNKERFLYATVSRSFCGIILGIFIGLGIALTIWDLMDILEVYPGEYISIHVISYAMGGFIAGIMDGLRLLPAYKTPNFREIEYKPVLKMIAKIFWMIFNVVILGLFLYIAFWYGNLLFLLEDLFHGIIKSSFAIIGIPTLIALVFGIRGAQQDAAHDIKTVERLSWSWKGIFIGLPLSPIVVIAMVSAYSFVGQTLFWFIFVFHEKITIILVYLMMYSPPVLIAIIISGLRGRTISVKTSPNQGIRLTQRNALFAAIATFLTLAIVISAIFGYIPLKSFIEKSYIMSFEDDLNLFLRFLVILVLPISISAALVCFLWVGGFDIIQHFTLRWFVWIRRRAAFRLIRFLDYATDMVFLRKVGNGYIFIHRMLLEYFAAIEVRPESQKSTKRKQVPAK